MYASVMSPIEINALFRYDPHWCRTYWALEGWNYLLHHNQSFSKIMPC